MHLSKQPNKLCQNVNKYKVETRVKVDLNSVKDLTPFKSFSVVHSFWVFLKCDYGIILHLQKKMKKKNKNHPKYFNVMDFLVFTELWFILIHSSQSHNCVKYNMNILRLCMKLGKKHDVLKVLLKLLHSLLLCFITFHYEFIH